MNEQEIKASYEYAKLLQEANQRYITAEKRLERLEHIEMMLRMWVMNESESDRGVSFFTDGRDEIFRIGYNEAQKMVESILADSKSEVNDRYKALLNKFENE